MYCRVIALIVPLFRSLVMVMLGAAITVNSIAAGLNAHMQLRQNTAASPQPSAPMAMACHEAMPQAVLTLPLQQVSKPGHADQQVCQDTLCCVLALSPLAPVLTMHISTLAAPPRFFYVDQVLEGYFVHPDPPPRPVL